MRDMAPVMYRYKDHLTDQGFTEDQAMMLVLEAQRCIMEAGHLDEDPEDDDGW